MAPKVHVRKGDTVKVMSGDAAGKSGKVLEVNPTSQRVVVDGVNIIKKHTKPSRSNPQGGVIERPGALHASKVMLVCPNCDEAVRAGNTKANDGSTVRVCKKCGKAID